MTAIAEDVFADTAFWIALVVKQNQYHLQAQRRFNIYVPANRTLVAPL